MCIRDRSNQINDLKLDIKTNKIAATIIASLDEAGQLCESLEDILEILNYQVNQKEVEAVLVEIIQDLEPPGIGYRDFKECIKIQINKKKLDPETKMLCFEILYQNQSDNLQNIKSDWHFLTGDQESIKKIADSIGFIYYYDEDRDEYMHPAAISVLSPEGKISRYLYGIQFLEKDLKLSLLEAGEGKIGSTLDKIILYCYHYDPYKNTYTLFATNVMRLGGILTIIFLGITIVGYWKNDHNLFRG